MIQTSSAAFGIFKTGAKFDFVSARRTCIVTSPNSISATTAATSRIRSGLTNSYAGPRASGSYIDSLTGKRPDPR
jgi:hypothetical protein